MPRPAKRDRKQTFPALNFLKIKIEKTKGISEHQILIPKIKSIC
jgi:hypothetical protein